MVNPTLARCHFPRRTHCIKCTPPPSQAFYRNKKIHFFQKATSMATYLKLVAVYSVYQKGNQTIISIVYVVVVSGLNLQKLTTWEL